MPNLADLIYERMSVATLLDENWLRQTANEIADEWFRLADEEAKRLLGGINIE